jgi:archaellum component FlaC
MYLCLHSADRGELQASREKCGALNGELDSMKRSLEEERRGASAVAEELERMRIKAERLEGEMRQAREEMGQAHSAAESKHQSVVTGLQEEITRLRAECGQLKKKTETLSKELVKASSMSASPAPPHTAGAGTSTAASPAKATPQETQALRARIEQLEQKLEVRSPSCEGYGGLGAWADTLFCAGGYSGARSLQRGARTSSAEHGASLTHGRCPEEGLEGRVGRGLCLGARWHTL